MRFGRNFSIASCCHWLAFQSEAIERLGPIPHLCRNLLDPKVGKMSPPIRPPKQRRGFLKKPKSSSDEDKSFRIVQVEEDKQDEMHYSDLVRYLVMLQPITAAAAVITGYRYWKLQFSQLLLLQSLGLDMKTRLIFAVIDFLLSSKTSCSRFLRYR